jgi:hypothetical protein
LPYKESTEELLHTPEICRIFAPWFDLNSLHETERREAVEWFCEKYACNSGEAEEREELAGWLKTYKRHRNFIVKLYEEEHSVCNASLIQSKSIFLLRV